MANSTIARKRPLIDVPSGLYTAVMGALGDIFTLFAIPVAPNININLYVLSGIMVGATSGWLLGGIAGFIGALYTPVLWGWLGAIPYNAFLGFFVGLCAQKWGLRPAVGGLIGLVLTIPYTYLAETKYLGLPTQIYLVGQVSGLIQQVVAIVIVEILIVSPVLRKRLPRVEMHAPSWVASNAIIRHPWVSSAKA